MYFTSIRILSVIGIIVLASITSCVKDVDQPSPDYTPVINEIPIEKEKNFSESFSDLVSSYENVDRQNWQKPRMIVQSLGDLSDKVVADIGSGTGYFTLRMLPLAKKVIAIDIDERMITFIDDLKSELDTRFSDKLETRLATTDDPKLGMQEVDIIFISNTYAYISDRIDYLKKLKSKLKPGGKIVIIDFKKKLIPGVIHSDQANRLALFQVEQELQEAGFTLVKSDDLSLPYQYIVEAR